LKPELEEACPKGILIVNFDIKIFVKLLLLFDLTLLIGSSRHMYISLDSKWYYKPPFDRI
jgi:hypothetical protein